MTKVKANEMVAFVNDRLANKLPVSDAIIAEHFGVTRQNVQRKRKLLEIAGLWPEYKRKIGHPTVVEEYQKTISKSGAVVAEPVNANNRYLEIINDLQNDNERLRKENLELKISHVGAGVPGLVKLLVDAEDFGIDKRNLTYHINENLPFSLTEYNITFVPKQDTKYALTIN